MRTKTGHGMDFGNRRPWGCLATADSTFAAAVMPTTQTRLSRALELRCDPYKETPEARSA